MESTTYQVPDSPDQDVLSNDARTCLWDVIIKSVYLMTETEFEVYAADALCLADPFDVYASQPRIEAVKAELVAGDFFLRLEGSKMQVHYVINPDTLRMLEITASNTEVSRQLVADGVLDGIRTSIK